jgi:hypothetical protein
LKPELDAALCQAVNALLVKDAVRRPSDAAKVAERLRASAGGAATSTAHNPMT